ncbi:electron transfer flavoprotein subunit beta/FixA family protein [Oscillochloris sp. ZM17-4]|uniref:electron transfer flavoprotein subunit beta/FixA family protein n=1 Tax=Oscillochloris sp. ZM17-4 TaxID=2866714 RepID=UPI001C733EBA|nr:electron transfer flavoprotein subunit beta/FixA family protein [Oscillochloris sp. ZM17-4]MBX0328921.1 electron transfer flavoprotein subunit beta/FixA family protein [Oscillochloris sp. ZM17-4]
MHSVVAIKQVPDTSNVRINPETGTLIREGVPTIINPYDIHAVEMAVRIKEQFGGTVTVITMGPPKAMEALIECVEQGADRGILISDRRFGAADTLATSYVLAHTVEALQEAGPVDLLLFGKQAIDGDTGQVGPGVAARLHVPLLSNAVAIESFDPVARKAVIHRKIEQGIEVIETSLPALLTVEKEIAAVKRAPLPNLINAASYKPELWTADAPVPFDIEQVGIKGSPTIVGKAFTPPAREAGAIMSVAEKGLSEAVADALAMIVQASVVTLPNQNGGRP